jgi:dipeptidyl-peptidase-4
MQWTKDANVLSAQVLNRHQNNLDLLFIDGTQVRQQLF